MHEDRRSCKAGRSVSVDTVRYYERVGVLPTR